jgi:hypothetical protein
LARDRPNLTLLEKTAFQQVFRGEVPGKAPCQWCGGLHQRGDWIPPGPVSEASAGFRWQAACPRVRRMEFHPNGNLISITFAEGRWDESGVVFPEDAFDPGSDEEPGA